MTKRNSRWVKMKVKKMKRTKRQRKHERKTRSGDKQRAITKTKDNEKKRYNTALNKHKSRINVLEDKTKWLQEYKSNDEIANWPGYTIIPSRTYH